MPYQLGQPWTPVYKDTRLKTKPIGPAAVGTLAPHNVTLADRLENAVTGGLKKVGVGDRQSNRLGAKLAGVLDALTPAGTAISADDTKNDLQAGHYGSAAGNALLTALGMVPEGKAAGLVGAKLGGAKLGSTLLHSIIAPLFHGSAAKFDRFANDFIGTGEGAQAYGFGHYLTESKRLAGSYRNPKLDPAKAYEDGHLYQVSVDAEPEHFVHMDAPLREQPTAVQELARVADLSKLKPGSRQRTVLERFQRGEEQPDYPATVQTLHSALTNYGADKDANRAFSQALAEQGFKGLSYGTSKDALGGGGLNYVVFDPSIIDITGKY
jgi:hypothetical protein